MPQITRYFCSKTLYVLPKVVYNGFMDNNMRMANLAEEKYSAIFGVHKVTFDTMLVILERAYEEMHKKGGRKRKLSVLNILIIFFAYYHDGRTMESLAFEYGVHKPRICEAIAWVEKTLSENDKFVLPSKRELINKAADISKLVKEVAYEQIIFKQLQGHPLFKNISPDNFEEILECLRAKWISYQKNESILNVGDKLDCIWVLLKGNVKFFYHNEDGDTLHMGVWKAPTLLNDTLIYLDEFNYSPSNIIAMDNCEAFLVAYNKLITICPKMCNFHIQLIKNLLYSMAIKTHALIHLVGVLSKKTTREKILSFLNMHKGQEKKITIPYNRVQMAHYLCVDRTSLSKELKKMQDEGLIRFNRNEFEILSSSER